MDGFFNLRAEKQEHIINAALTVFGRNSYKKASIADIAAEAGIAKGMVMYYFGSKKNLYLFLAERCKKVMTDEIEKGYSESVTEFFDNIKMVTDIKIAIMKNHPALLSFLTNLYFETDEEVLEDTKGFISDGMDMREKLVYHDVDISKFKDDIDPKLIDKLLVWAAEGFISSMQKEINIGEIEKFTKDLYACLDIMKEHFYKS